MNTLTQKQPLVIDSNTSQIKNLFVVDEPVLRVETDKIDDNAILKSVNNALSWSKIVPKKGIQVFVESGKVILTGEVQNWHQKNAATQVVEGIVGVEVVSNQLIIKPIVKEADVKSRIKNTFLQIAQIDADRIKVEIQKDEVVLLGTVRSLAEKLDAEYAARSTPGINRVFNYLKVIS